jgi:hypothetical protein
MLWTRLIKTDNPFKLSPVAFAIFGCLENALGLVKMLNVKK